MVFNRLIDRVLRLERFDRAEIIDNLQRALAFVPAARSLDRRTFVRKIMVQDALRRLTFRMMLSFPYAVYALAAAVPLRGAVRELRAADPNRPIIFAQGHFGLVLLSITALIRRTKRRKIFVVHRDYKDADVTAAYFRKIGATPIRSNESSLLAVMLAIRDNPNCAVLIAFDWLGGSAQQPIYFLGMPVVVPSGLAYLADVENATVFTTWWEGRARGPRVVVNGPYKINKDLIEQKRQGLMTRELFARLEEQIAKHPAQWTCWDVLAWTHVEARNRKLADALSTPNSSRQTA